MGAKFIYSGSMTSSLRWLKRVSVTSFGVAWGVVPLTAIIDYSVTSPGLVIGAVGGALVAGSTSTALIHWAFSSYVVRILYHGQAGKPLERDSFITLETLNVFGRPVLTTLPVSSLEPSKRAFSTWGLKAIPHSLQSAANFYSQEAKAFYESLPLAERGSKCIAKFSLRRNYFYVHPPPEEGSTDTESLEFTRIRELVAKRALSSELKVDHRRLFIERAKKKAVE